MASPEVERPTAPPLTSPSHQGLTVARPQLSGDKRKAINFRCGTYFNHDILVRFQLFTNHDLLRHNRYGNIKPKASSSNQVIRRSYEGIKANNPLRKRSYSFTEGHCKSVTSVTPAKRWKRSKDAKKFYGLFKMLSWYVAEIWQCKG